ncbi:hypothetical protein Skr01_08880 [Sphaerisporangium krabiense]|uniref:chitinase n=1 Tax=Sphaerisporangium krabiense TaxID=763782 RepID=A0A7W8ZCI6_9ACTN|nr:glycosyl hydrolase family 18 protein [Sphaerisporangium krabiense]MBB5631385.1 chitinase/chitodextrinase [Sphaerisporangium krabiense]GII60803.1 hypothetical protein Skr01_08880 [Sphaerisporangium krabiense]
MRPKRNPIILLATLVLSTAAVSLTPGAAVAASPTAIVAKTSSSTVAAAAAAWAPNTAYTAGTIVSYNGQDYRCVQAHTSLPGWEPPNVPALWAPAGGSGTDTTAPSVPGNVRVTATTSNSVSLAWNASTDNVGVTGYEVYRGTTLVTTATGTSYTDSGLTAQTTYSYTIRARDAAGNRSAASAAVSATTTGGNTGAPGQPGTASATTTDTSIALSWGASTGTVTGYRVYEGTTQKAQVTGTSTTISGLGTCESHTYTIKAYNSVGESAGRDVSATTTGCASVPGKPGTPTATAGATSIALSWSASSGTVTGYRVYEGTTQKAQVTGTSATVGSLGSCESHTYTVKAYNAQGESPASDAVTATTTGCTTGGPLPKHFLTGYWHNFVNPAVELKLSAVPNDYDLIAIAFAEATSTPGQLSFQLDPALATAVGGYTEAEFKADIQSLHARGKKVILSVGGEAGRVQVGSSSAATAFADSAYALMQSYGFDGVDIDLENGLNATYMADALRKLRAKAGADLIITMAPQTIDMQSTGMTYFQLALAIKDILTVVHTQFYNSGSMLGCDQSQAYSQGTVNFMTALACIQLENGLRPDQVALGLPAGPGAAGGGVVSPGLVNQALDCLATKTNCGSFVPPRTYPGIRGAMTWSINWDASNNWNFSRTIKPHLATLP